jgi:hypothetical protein
MKLAGYVTSTTDDESAQFDFSRRISMVGERMYLQDTVNVEDLV